MSLTEEGNAHIAYDPVLVLQARHRWYQRNTSALQNDDMSLIFTYTVQDKHQYCSIRLGRRYLQSPQIYMLLHKGHL